MDLVRNIVRKLDKDGFEELKNFISGQRDSKSKQLLELLRKQDVKDELLAEKLDVSPGAFYTLKSRLVPRVVQFYTNLNENKIRLLREEAARVSFIVYNNEKMISLSFLKDLEKKLREYDMSSELAVIYKQLARLQRFDDSHDYYEREYQKHIAFSLAVSKAEDLLYEYIYNLGYYQLTSELKYQERLEDLLDELENTFNLYESHRLYTIFQIVKHYHQCNFLSQEELAMEEIAVEERIRTMQEILERYSLDPFYGIIRNLIPFLFFEYYVRIGNKVKANYYLEQISFFIEDQFKAHLWSFFITQFLISIMQKLKNDGDLGAFLKLSDKFRQGYFVEDNELSHLITYFRYKSLTEFYAGNYSKAALVINNLRQITRFKDFPVLETEFKILQALMYVLNDDQDLYQKLIQSAKRQAKSDPKLHVSVKTFSKVLFLLSKHKMERVDEDKLLRYWKLTQQKEYNPVNLMAYLYLNETMLTDLLKQ